MRTTHRTRQWAATALRLLGRLSTWLLVSSTEMLLGVALVLVLSLAFMGILTLSFPKGTGLVNLYDELVDYGRGRSDARLRGGRQEQAAFVAVLETVRHRVRDRRSDAFTWSDAHAGMRLEDHHTIQTLGHSGASITFGEQGQLELGERSLVVVKRQEARRRSHASVVLLGGRVQGRAAGDSRFEIVTAGGTSQIRSRDESGTEFSVTMNEDDSSTLAVYSGAADVDTGHGPLAVGPNEALTYGADGVVSRRERIPDTPRLEAPRNGHLVTFGPVAPRIELRWQPQPEATGYQVELSRQADFSDLVYSGKTTAAAFVHGDLPAGRYFWRARTIVGRAESLPSPTREFQLRQDLTAPELTVLLPGQVVTTDTFVLRGATEVGGELFVGNESVPIDEQGEFEYTMRLERGLNMIVIEAVDQVGNSTYRSQYVTARY